MGVTKADMKADMTTGSPIGKITTPDLLLDLSIEILARDSSQLVPSFPLRPEIERLKRACVSFLLSPLLILPLLYSRSTSRS